MSDLMVDPERLDLETGIFVRAVHNGEWGSYDIAELTKESLMDWMRYHDDVFRTRVVLLVLGHSL